MKDTRLDEVLRAVGRTRSRREALAVLVAAGVLGGAGAEKAGAKPPPACQAITLQCGSDADCCNNCCRNGFCAKRKRCKHKNNNHNNNNGGGGGGGGTTSTTSTTPQTSTTSTSTTPTSSTTPPLFNLVTEG